MLELLYFVHLDKMITFKVADFGLASTDGANIDSGKLPIKWTAPEVGFFKEQISSMNLFVLHLLTHEVTKRNKLFCFIFNEIKKHFS